MVDVSNWSSPDKERVFSYLEWHGFLSEKYKLLYVATPKVACTSLKWWFAELTGYAETLRGFTESAETDPELIIHDSFRKVAKDVTGLAPEMLLTALCSDEYYRFALVRNPYKRIFSAWQSKILLREPLQIGPYQDCDFFNMPIVSAQDIAEAFEGFLVYLDEVEAPNYLDLHWMPQKNILRPDLINYTRLDKIEKTDSIGAELKKRVGPGYVDPFCSASKKNETLIPCLPEYITSKSSEIIIRLYEEDFVEFGYDSDFQHSNVDFNKDQLDIALMAVNIIRGRHKRLGEMSEQILTLYNLVHLKEKQLHDMCNSSSWKITSPLRRLKKIANLKQKVMSKLGVDR